MFLFAGMASPWYNCGMKIQQGVAAPDFALSDQQGKTHTLSDYRGRWVLLYFYPKDDTPGCTKEACGVRDAFPKFKKMSAVVFGVSADSVQKHKKFAEKYNLPFILLSDEEKQVIKTYGLWAKKKFMGREYMGIMRTSFLIDPKGIIAKVYEQVKPEQHAKDVLMDLQTLQKS